MRRFVVMAALSTFIAAPTFAQTSPTTAGLPHQSSVMLADHTMRASKLVGMPVYNDAGEKVGTVDDILVTAGAVEPTAIVSVGTFLGVSERLVKEPLSHLKLAPGAKMMMPNATKAAIAAKPVFQYQYGLAGGGG